MSYIQVNDELYLNEQNIVSIKKINDCLIITTVPTDHYSFFNTYNICKAKNSNYYNELNYKLKTVK